LIVSTVEFLNSSLTCFKNGKEVNRLSGALPPDELEQFLKQLVD
jgi:thioredoxin-like negative regulator of GroEL